MLKLSTTHFVSSIRHQHRFHRFEKSIYRNISELLSRILEHVSLDRSKAPVNLLQRTIRNNMEGRENFKLKCMKVNQIIKLRLKNLKVRLCNHHTGIISTQYFIVFPHSGCHCVFDTVVFRHSECQSCTENFHKQRVVFIKYGNRSLIKRLRQILQDNLVA